MQGIQAQGLGTANQQLQAVQQQQEQLMQIQTEVGMQQALIQTQTGALSAALSSLQAISQNVR